MTAAETQRRQLLLGYLASMGAALSYGAGTLVSRKIVIDYASPMVATAFSLVFGLVIMAVVFHRHALSDLSLAPRRAWGSMTLAGLGSALGVSSFFLALSKAPVVLVAPLTGTYPLVAILLTHFFLQRLERVSWHTIMGGGLVVAGVTLITVGIG